MNLRIVLLLCILLQLPGKSQENCFFKTMDDTIICFPAEVEIWVSGSNLDQVKWFGSNINTDETLNQIKATVDKTTIFYITNRIADPTNLIVNGDFELGNQDFTGEYWASCFNGSMPQGSYCINNKSNIYWPSWQACIDHTETGIGNMYITDGAIVPDEQIWCQTVDVEQETDYSLSAWITPILNLNNAQLQFTINDERIGDVFEAKPIECEWNEFFQIWNSNLNTSADICITNQNTASDGNDFAMDDISFNEVCYEEDSVKVTLIEPVNFSINKDTTICPGDKFLVKVDTAYNNDFSYTWNTSESKSTIEVSDIGEYILTIEHFSGCDGKDTLLVDAIENPTSLLGNDTTVCLSIMKGIPLIPGEAKWTVWNTPSNQKTTNNILATEVGQYSVTLFNGNNCFISDRIEIKDFCSTELFLPNSFTPNDDGYNDTFGAQSVETYSYKLIILNRNGKIIFESNNLSDRWDGKDAPQGIYVYQINYDIVNRDTGVLYNQQKVGTVTLLR